MTVYPPTTTFPASPITNPATAPVTFPPENAAPAIITFPGMNPVTVTPNSLSTPVPFTVPLSSPVPIINPATTPKVNPGQPLTNPVTTFPAPTVGVPVTAPVTTPFMPPATGNAPAVPGQSWCVAKSEASQGAMQSALDYACGAVGEDYITIQQNGSCYNPNIFQNHASFAFNSYYQKNPGPTSCDFRGAAMITNVNPSTFFMHIFVVVNFYITYSSDSLASGSNDSESSASGSNAIEPKPVVSMPTTASNGPAAVPSSYGI